MAKLFYLRDSKALELWAWICVAERSSGHKWMWVHWIQHEVDVGTKATNPSGNSVSACCASDSWGQNDILQDLEPLALLIFKLLNLWQSFTNIFATVLDLVQASA